MGESPSAFKLQHSSPLSTLLRRASARKVSTPTVVISGDSPERQYEYNQQQAPAQSPPLSPLLHSRFARASIATESSRDNDSFMDNAPSFYDRDDQDSIYSSSAARDSWQSSDDGRAPVINTLTNYSRPARRTEFLSPARPPDSTKRQVLERNAQKHSSPHGRPPHNQREYSPSNLSSTPYMPPSPSSTPSSYQQTPGHVSSVYQEVPSTYQTPVSSPYQQSYGNTAPRTAPSAKRLSPATSIYSQYSFYQLESAAPSPQASVTKFPPLEQIPMSRTPEPPAPPAAMSGPSPEELLQEGIVHHEANRLRESYICFERSARENGGSGVGRLMYGLSLRSGWGCEKNEKAGFKWIHKAAEAAVDNLDRVRQGGEPDDAVKTNLILAVYELGQCYYHGWGVDKNREIAISYYRVAARYGDMDAQNDLAFALANGKGCKKDRKEAAKWYRAAVAQGASDVGLAWIHKEKLQ